MNLGQTYLKFEKERLTVYFVIVTVDEKTLKYSIHFPLKKWLITIFGLRDCSLCVMQSLNQIFNLLVNRKGDNREFSFCPEVETINTNFLQKLFILYPTTWFTIVNWGYYEKNYTFYVISYSYFCNCCIDRLL